MNGITKYIKVYNTWQMILRYPACAGKSQSPIDINPANAVIRKESKPFNFIGYNISIQGYVTDNGHSLGKLITSLCLVLIVLMDPHSFP